jgi:3-methyladenine DNA glycosylase AlkD
MINPKKYVADLARIYQEMGHPDTAAGQKAYMRHKFDFFGLKMQEWRTIFDQYRKEQAVPAYGGELETVVRLLYQSDYREMHATAIYLIEKTQRKSGPELIQLLEELITKHSWWDSVDWIAKLVGIHLMRYPEQKEAAVKNWINSDNFWLQRVAIIFQLSYKDKTDEQLLFANILKVADSKEFFLQKAAGWALRQHSKIRPQAVIEFVNSHRLAPLTKREALRLLK